MKKTLYIALIISLISSCNTLKKPMSKNDEYLELTKELIEVNDEIQTQNYLNKLKSYQEKPESVFDNGEYYYDTENNEFQAYRGASEELTTNIEWFLLIDNLEFGNYLWELDWKTGFKESYAVIKVLADKKKYELPSLDESNEGEINDLDTLFANMNKILEENNLVLVNLYIDSDSYVTGIMKLENLEKTLKLAQNLGHKITKY